MIGIYKITNKITQDFYIGSSINIEKRLKNHKKNLCFNKHKNQHLQNAWNKYGENNFEFLIIEECLEDLRAIKEQYYINTFKPIYNICKIVGQYSKQTRDKISKTLSGRKLSEEAKQHLRKINLGKHHSQETKEKCRLAGMKNKGPFSEEHKKHLSEAHKGKSPSNKGKPGKLHTKEWKKMMSIKMLGKNNPFYGKHHIKKGINDGPTSS